MDNNYLVILASCLVLTALTSFKATASPPAIPEENITWNNSILTLIYLGNVGGKALFAEPNITMNWTAAGEFCQASKLELVEIESKAEVDFLKTAMEGYPNFWYWTAARESRTIDGLVWNGSDTIPSTSTGFHWHGHSGGPEYYYCGMLVPQDSAFHAALCSERRYVLCQSKS